MDGCVSAAADHIPCPSGTASDTDEQEGKDLYNITSISQLCPRAHLLEVEWQFVDFKDEVWDWKLNGPF